MLIAKWRGRHFALSTFGSVGRSPFARRGLSLRVPFPAREGVGVRFFRLWRYRQSRRKWSSTLPPTLAEGIRKISRRLWPRRIFPDDDLERGDGLDSDADDLDSAAGFESVAGFDVESPDDAVVPLVAGFSVVEVESESALGVLFLA